MRWTSRKFIICSVILILKHCALSLGTNSVSVVAEPAVDSSIEAFGQSSFRKTSKTNARTSSTEDYLDVLQSTLNESIALHQQDNRCTKQRYCKKRKSQNWANRDNIKKKRGKETNEENFLKQYFSHLLPTSSHMGRVDETNQQGSDNEKCSTNPVEFPIKEFSGISKRKGFSRSSPSDSERSTLSGSSRIQDRRRVVDHKGKQTGESDNVEVKAGNEDSGSQSSSESSDDKYSAEHVGNPLSADTENANRKPRKVITKAKEVEPQYCDYRPYKCKEFAETGFCRRGDSCIFAHDRSDYMARVRGKIEGKIAAEKHAARLRMLITDNCPLCSKPYKEPMVTLCGHHFCAACIFAVSQKPGGERCPTCGSVTHGAFQVAEDMQNRIRASREAMEAMIAADKVVDPDEVRTKEYWRDIGF